MIAGIVIDKWKLDIFTRHLTAAGYSFNTSAGLTPNVLTLTVQTESGIALQRVVESANRECAISRRQ